MLYKSDLNPVYTEVNKILQMALPHKQLAHDVVL